MDVHEFRKYFILLAMINSMKDEKEEPKRRYNVAEKGEGRKGELIKVERRE